MDSTPSKSKTMKALIVVAVVVLSALLVCQGLGLNQSMSIANSGRILVKQSARAAESQWRGISIGQADESAQTNWTLIASTCASYDINFVDMDVIRNYETMYQSAVVSQLGISPPINFTQAISTFHAYGIQVYAHFSTMYKEYNADGIDRNCWYVPQNGNLSSLQEYFPGTGWLDIANPATPPLIKNLVTELVSNYNIDGIVFDYTRWDDTYMPLGNYDMAQFKANTGLDVNANYTTWINDILPVAQGGTGLYTHQFFEWRTQLVDMFVKNITQWALAINPNLQFGASPHSLLPLYQGGYPDYWSYEQGQDAAYWISQGYIQFVMPMMYTNNTAYLAGQMQSWEKFTTGGAHGIIPIVPYITDGDVANPPANWTTAAFAGIVSSILANGADGWIVYYGNGPGADHSSAQDITPFLAALGIPNPQTFALTNITTQALNSTSKRISWITSSAANSTVEYNSSQLFAWSQLTATDMISSGFPYWQDTYATGFVISDTASVTNHVITLTGLNPGTTYYFRIQSGDPSGIATTPVMTFST